MTDFQSTVNITQAPGVEGQRANTNPIVVLPSSVEGGWRAEAAGITVGRFAWATDDTGYEDSELSNAGSGKPLCFVPLNFGEAMITTYLAASGMVIQGHMPVGNPIVEGDYWVKHVGASAVTRGMKAYASLTTGQVQFAATGATISGYIETDWYAASPAAAGELVIMTSRVIN